MTAATYRYVNGAEGGQAGQGVYAGGTAGPGERPWDAITHGIPAYTGRAAHGNLAFAFPDRETSTQMIWKLPDQANLDEHPDKPYTDGDFTTNPSITVSASVLIPAPIDLTPPSQFGAAYDATLLFGCNCLWQFSGSQYLTAYPGFNVIVPRPADGATTFDVLMSSVANEQLTVAGLPLDTWLTISGNWDYTSQLLTLSVTNPDGIRLYSGGAPVQAPYAGLFDIRGASAAYFGDTPRTAYLLDDCLAHDATVATSPPPDPDPDPYYTDDEPPPASEIEIETNPYTESATDWTTPIPCPTGYRVARRSHSPTALLRLGKALGYRATMLKRGGRVTVFDLPPAAVTGVTWERRVNEVAETSVTLAKPAGARDRLAPLGKLEPWACELALWRIPARGIAQLVSVGPYTNYTENSTQITLLGRDLTAWWAKRAVHTDYSFTDCRDLAEIARFLINDAIAPDDPGMLEYLRFYPTGISAKRAGAGNRLMLDAEMSDLAGLGLDWTTVGRRIVLSGDLAGQWPHVARLGAVHFTADVEVEAAGDETLTRVWKSGSDDSGALGYAGGVDGALGLLETTDSDDALTDNATARTAARVALASAYPTPLYVRVPDDSGLTSDAPVTLEQLIPGVGIHVTVDGYVRPVAELQRLTRVAGAWDRDSGETIAVSLAPWAAVPTDDAVVLATATDRGITDTDVESDPDDAVTDTASPYLLAAPLTTDGGDLADGDTLPDLGDGGGGANDTSDDTTLTIDGGDPSGPGDD